MTPRLLATHVALILLASCADANHDSTQPAPTQNPWVSTYCETMMEAYCGFYLRCGRIVATDLEACRSLFLESCNGRYERWYGALADAGLLTLAATGIENCQTHLATVACENQVKDLDGPCVQMWVGAQGPGAPCGLGIESLVCEPGTTCVLDLSFCGVCRTEVGPDDVCDSNRVCGNAGNCQNGMCVARTNPGGACAEFGDCLAGLSCVDNLCTGPSYVGAGSPCDMMQRCVYGTTCIGGTCRPQARLLAPCSDTEPCVASYCDTSAGEPGQCVPFKEPGDACTTSGECLFSLCIAGVCNNLPSSCF